MYIIQNNIDCPVATGHRQSTPYSNESEAITPRISEASLHQTASRLQNVYTSGEDQESDLAVVLLAAATARRPW